MTHLHIDHVGGLLTPDGKPVFAKADLLIAQAEGGFWLDEGNASAAPEAARGTFDVARRMTAPYGERMHLFTDNAPMPGIEAMPLPGHTPGHTGYALGSGDQRLLIWDDIVHMPDIQCRRVLAEGGFALAASERLLVAGMHVHFPGFIRITSEGDGYAMHPIAWQPVS